MVGVTALLVLANVILFTVPWAIGRLDDVLVGGGFIAERLWSDVAMPGLAVSAWLTPFSSSFLHFDWAHLAFNMLMLWVIGRQLEPVLGTVRVLALYALGAAAGAAGQAVVAPPDAVMVGASGAVSALLATYAFIMNDQHVPAIPGLSPPMVRALWLAVAWIGLQLLIGLAGGPDGGIAIGSHIAAFVAGLVAARPILRSRFRL